MEATIFTEWWPVFALFVIAYLFGSISTAIISCKLMGLPDPRTLGSGNPGATNVLRSGSKKAAIITLLGDAFKGFLPVLAAVYLLPEHPDWSHLLVGVGAFIGHVFPVYYKFQGGKGVATAYGVLGAYCWQVFVAALVTWLVMAAIFRYSALAALTAFVLAPGYLLLFGGSQYGVIICCAISALIYWRHRGNIKRLLKGEESKIGNRS